MNGTYLSIYTPVTMREGGFSTLYFMFTGDIFVDESFGMQFVFCTNVTLTPDQDPERLDLLMIPIHVEDDIGEVNTDTCRVAIIDDDGKLLNYLIPDDI